MKDKFNYLVKMKTKLISLMWRGSVSVDPRFSAVMLPWSIVDIRNRELYNKLSVGVENGLLEAYNSDFEIQFTHNVKYIVGMCKIITRSNKNDNNTKNKYPDYTIVSVTKNLSRYDGNIMEICGIQSGLIYLVKNPRDPLLHIHLYESDSIEEMNELMQQMRDPVLSMGGSVGNIPHSIVPPTSTRQTLTTATAGSSNSSSNNDLTLQNILRGHGIQSTPASNLKLSESLRAAYHDGSPNLISSTPPRMSMSKSYTSGLNQSAGTITSNSINGSSNNLSLLNDISTNHSQLFEVLFIGKIRVSHRRVPFTFIDDALPKFKDAQRMRLQNAELTRQNSTCSEDDPNEIISQNNERKVIHQQLSTDSDVTLPIIGKTPSITQTASFSEDDESCIENNKNNINNSKEDDDDDTKENTTPSIIRPEKLLLRGQSQVILSTAKYDSIIQPHQQQQSQPPPDIQLISQNIETTIPKQRDRSASIGSIPYTELNRTMVFLVGKSDLRIVSPDRKQVLLYKEFRDVASCAQGHKNPDHFGIICREVNSEGFIGYIFKCQSEHVADDIVAAISQAFHTCSEQKNKDKQILSCEHCPMLWYHKLCTDIDGLNDKKAQTLIFRRICTLTEEEENDILAKYIGAEDNLEHTLSEQNQFIMMLLRAHCESRQQRHVHDTAENRSEFLNQYLGGSTIFMKAKKSLDFFIKKKHNAKDDQQTTSSNNDNDSNDSGKNNKNSNDNKIKNGSSPTVSRQNSDFTGPPQLKSPMIDIFMKVGNSPKDGQNHAGSWRQAILHRVVTPSKNNLQTPELLSPLRYQQQSKKSIKRSREDLRELWRTAIKQIILLSRMEKENARLLERQNENEIKRIKLEYDEITPCDRQSAEMWENYIENESRITTKCDRKVLLQAIKNGVPRTKRGDVWMFLAEQFSISSAPIDKKKFPKYNIPYHTLLKDLTEHQHAIFIDLGRTFPNHKYYKQSLGVGQLSLFNLLKAYSILDPELGYCQGLGFICGVLLLHLEEAEAFEMLKHLMFRRQMRTKYLPDMKNFQLQLYQISRLLKDQIPELYDWLDTNEVSPTLYAAPWILTVFSSQFPLGFVTRVFDLLFLESSEIIFRVAIALLEVHKDELLKRDNFEDIMDYMKNVIPKMNVEVLDKIMRQVFLMDINNKLAEYHVEYNVLQEEITTQNHHIETLNRAKENNLHLEQQLQIAQTSITHLEKIRQQQNNQIQNLQSQVQSIEVTVQTLGNFLINLIENNHNIDLPGDVRRIVQQVHAIEQRNNLANNKRVVNDRKMGKSMSVNSNLGLKLRVLEELNESLEKDMTSPKKEQKRVPFLENSSEQIKQQKAAMKLNTNKMDNSEQGNENKKKHVDFKLPEHVEKAISNMKSPNDYDSGISTPISPQMLSDDSTDSTPNSTPITNNKLIKKKLNESKSMINLQQQSHNIELLDNLNEDYLNKSDMHPLSNCNDVNFSFNGTTTQLKTLRPIHKRAGNLSRTVSEQDNNSISSNNIRS